MKMDFLKKSWGNVVFLLIIALLFIPQTGTPIKIFIQRIIAFSPTEVKKEDRIFLKDYNWQLTKISSEKVHFEVSKDRVILLNYWATWCPPCIAEMPSLQKLYEKYGDKMDFYFVSSEEPQILQQFLSKKGFTLPVYIQKMKSPSALESKSLPTTFLISKKGEVIIRETGSADWNSEKVHLLIDRMLSE